MPNVFYANQVRMVSTRSDDPTDQGDILLTFECALPSEDGTYESLGTVVIGLTHANGARFSQALAEQLAAHDRPSGLYRGPTLSR